MTDYINERYPSAKLSDWLERLSIEGFSIYRTSHGFCTYRVLGDSLIISDLYVKLESRGLKKAWELFYKMRDIARRSGAFCMLTFADYGGINQHLGRAAIKAIGFKLAHELENRSVFIRGVD